MRCIELDLTTVSVREVISSHWIYFKQQQKESSLSKVQIFYHTLLW